MRALVPSAVATLPAMRSRVGNARLSARIVSTTLEVWPWAVSTTSTSTPARTRASARASRSSPVPTAAPTRKRPSPSLHASGCWIVFSMSLTVIRPLRCMRSSTTSSFSILCRCKISLASSRLTPGRAVMRRSLVMTSETRRSSRISKRRSRFVRIPTNLPSLVTGSPEM